MDELKAKTDTTAKQLFDAVHSTASVDGQNGR